MEYVKRVVSWFTLSSVLLSFSVFSKPEIQSVTLDKSTIQESEDVVMTVSLAEPTTEHTEYFFKLLTSEQDANLTTSANDFQPILMFSYQRDEFNISLNEWQGIMNLNTRNSWKVPDGVDTFKIRLLAKQNRENEQALETAAFSVSPSDVISDGTTVNFNIENLSELRPCGSAKMSYMLPSAVPVPENSTVSIVGGFNQLIVCNRSLNVELLDEANFYPFVEAATSGSDYDPTVRFSYFWYNAQFDRADETVIEALDLSEMQSVELPRGTYAFQMDIEVLDDTLAEDKEVFDILTWFSDDTEKAFLNIRDIVIEGRTVRSLVSIVPNDAVVEEGEQEVVAFNIDHGSAPQDFAVTIAIEDDRLPQTGLTASANDYSSIIEVSNDGSTWSSLALRANNTVSHIVPSSVSTFYVRLSTVDDGILEEDETLAVSGWIPAEAGSYKFARVTIEESTPPADAVDDESSTSEDQPVNIDVLSNDIGEGLTIVSIGSASNGTVTQNSSSLVYTPNNNFNGTDSFSYTIEDSAGQQDSATVTVNIAAVNDAPVATDDSATTNEDTSISNINVLVNDSDPEGQSLTVSIVSISSGTATVNVDNSIDYAPTENFNGDAIIVYSISDGSESDQATLTVTVTPVNDDPIAQPDSAAVDEDQSTVINVLANDSDPDGTNVTLSVVTATASNGQVVINSDGSLSYTPNPNYFGDDTITYSISDGEGGSATSTVSVTVNPVNDAPIAEDDAVTTDEDVSIANINVLSNDSDPEGQSLSVSIVSVSSGTATVNSDNSINYTPETNVNGSVNLVYSVSDGELSDQATVVITINPLNDNPVAQPDSLTVPEDQTANVNVLANDSDPDGSNVTLTVTSAVATNGQVSINGDGSLSYTPNQNFFGTDTIVYSISDGEGGIASSSVVVTVTPVNDAPIANDDTVSGREDEGISNIDVLANDIDVDTDKSALTISIDSVSNGFASINADKTFNFTPTINYNGPASITYTISDGEFNSTAVVNIEVASVNDSPRANPDAFTVPVNSVEFELDVLANDTDGDGDELVITGSTTTSGTLTRSADNKSLLFTPVSGFTGTVQITYTISDGNSGTDGIASTITVQ